MFLVNCTTAGMDDQRKIHKPQKAEQTNQTSFYKQEMLQCKYNTGM